MPQRTTGVGEWVRDYLQEHGTASVGEMHNAYTEWCIENDYNPPKEQSFRSTMWRLRQLDLVEVAPATVPGEFTAQYHRIRPGVSPDDDRWTDPRGALHPR